MQNRNRIDLEDMTTSRGGRHTAQRLRLSKRCRAGLDIG